MIKRFLSLILIVVCATTALADRPPKYTVFEGQNYRWNTQMKKYIPVESPRDRYMRRITEQQLKTQRQKTGDIYKVKWWDFFYN